MCLPVLQRKAKRLKDLFKAIELAVVRVTNRAGLWGFQRKSAPAVGLQSGQGKEVVKTEMQ